MLKEGKVESKAVRIKVHQAKKGNVLGFEKFHRGVLLGHGMCMTCFDNVGGTLFVCLMGWIECDARAGPAEVNTGFPSWRSPRMT